MALLRRFDAFVKPRSDLRTRSAAGGTITIVAATCATVLFFAEIYMYLCGTTQHSLHLSKSFSLPMLPSERYLSSPKGKTPLNLQVTFPHLTCNQLDFSLDDATFSSGKLEKVHGKQSFAMRAASDAEMKKAGGSSVQKSGCTIWGQFKVPVVAGDFALTITRRTWAEATSTLLMGMLNGQQENGGVIGFNVTHYVHYIRFGTPFPLAAAELLEGRLVRIENRMGGIALQQFQIKLIPTLYQRFLTSQETYQMSVVEHTVEPETLVAKGVPLLPGIAVSYDFTPLAVHHIEMRDNFFVFICSLISIVGGVFVTVGLVTGCLVHSAAAVAKKLD